MRLYFYSVCLSVVLAVWISCSVICQGLQIESNITDIPNSDSKKVKIICISPSKTFQLKRKLNIQSKVLDLNSDGSKKRANIMHSQNISVDFPKGYKCYLSTDYPVPRDSVKSRPPRQIRTSQASLPAKNGVCQPGYRIDQDRCYPCFPGSYTSGQETKCFLCPKDFYVSKEAADSCRPCPEGRKTLAEGAYSLDLCIRPDETNNNNNSNLILVITMLVFIIILSWIGAAVFIVYIVRSRRQRTLSKEKLQSALRSKRKKESIEVDVNDSIEISLRERNLNKNSSLQSTNNRRLENTTEETSTHTEPGVQLLRSADGTSDPEKDLQKSIFNIHTATRKNYFFLNPSGELFLQDLPLNKNKDRVKEVLKNGNLQYSVVDSDSSSSNSENYLSNNDEKSPFISQTNGKEKAKDKAMAASLEREENVSGRKKKSWKKGTNRMPASSNHNINDDLNQENGTLQPKLESKSSENEHSEKFENRNNDRNTSSSGNGTGQENNPPILETFQDIP